MRYITRTPPPHAPPIVYFSPSTSLRVQHIPSPGYTVRRTRPCSSSTASHVKEEAARRKRAAKDDQGQQTRHVFCHVQCATPQAPEWRGVAIYNGGIVSVQHNSILSSSQRGAYRWCGPVSGHAQVVRTRILTEAQKEVFGIAIGKK